MPKVAEILTAAMEAKNIRYAGLSGRADVSPTTIANIRKGRTKPTGATLYALARGLGFSTWEDVIRFTAPMLRGEVSTRSIPILADVPAGWGDGYDVQDAFNYEDGAQGYIPAAAVPNVSDPKAFALRVKGDSMTPRYQDGELVVCSPECFERHGFIDGKRYVMRLKGNDETTIKMVRVIDETTIELVPENPRHPTRRMDQSKIALAARVVARLVEE